MIQIDTENGTVAVIDETGNHTYPLNSPEAFRVVSDAWLRCGWDTKYVYGFSWMGRPIIQLPEDMIRIQEVLYAVQPDVIVETGVAHGGSLIFYASLFKAMGKGRVIGVDIEIRPHNRSAIEVHALSPFITLIEGDSSAPEIISKVESEIGKSESVLVMLDSNHSRDHVLKELRAYAPLVSKGSYIVAADGIMAKVAGAPRSEADWTTNNPITAIHEFLSENDNFKAVEPPFPFNEGAITERVTYWPEAFLQRVK